MAHECCWRRLLRGQRTWSAVDQRAGPGPLEASHPLPCPWKTFLLMFPQWEPVQGRSLKGALYCWDHLDSVWDWTQARLLYKSLRIWQTGSEIYLSCCYPRQASYIHITLLFKSATYQSTVGCLFFLSLSVPGYRVQFQISSIELLRLWWSNKCTQWNNLRKKQEVKNKAEALKSFLFLANMALGAGLVTRCDWTPYTPTPSALTALLSVKKPFCPFICSCAWCHLVTPTPCCPQRIQYFLFQYRQYHTCESPARDGEIVSGDV